MPRLERASPRYTETQATGWLSWLARGMQRQGQTVFLMEQLQPNWLSTRTQGLAYTIASRVIQGFVLGMLFMITVRPGEVAERGLAYGLVAGACSAIVETVRLHLGRKWAPRITSIYATVPMYALAVGLGAGLVSLLLAVPAKDILFDVLMTGIALGPIWGIRAARRDRGSDIRTTEMLDVSWSDAWKGALVGLGIGVGVGIIFILTPIVIADRRFLRHAPSATLLFYGLSGTAFGGMVSLFRARVLELKTLPNQGMMLTFRNAVLRGLFVGLPIGLFWWLSFMSDEPGRGPVVEATVYALLVGSVTFLWLGGLDVIQHYTLRIILGVTGKAPLRYARFLDYAANELGFLQKVGGGYIFVHRMLLEHFASLPERTAEVAQPSRSSPGPAG